MSIDIKLYKTDLPDDLDLGNNVLALDCEFMGLNVRKEIPFVLYKYLQVTLMHI